MKPIPEPQRHANARYSHHSSLIEKVLEYHLTGAITSELLLRDLPFELLRTDCDRDGYDLVIEAKRVIRHIQLKGQVLGGSSGEVTAHTNLASKPSACMIWMIWDPVTIRPTRFRFFGGNPGQPIPPLGDKIARHSKGNKDGDKRERPLHRVIAASRFERVADIPELVNRLFGPGPAPTFTSETQA